MVRAEEFGEKPLASTSVAGRIEAGRRIRQGVRGGVRIIICKVPFAGGLKGGHLCFCLGVSAMAPDGTRGAKSEASENSDDGNHSQKFDQGESGWPTQRTPSPDRVGVKTPRVTF